METFRAAEVEGLDLRSGQSRLTAEGGIGFDFTAARGLEFSLSGIDLASLLPRGSSEAGLRAPLAVSGRITADRFALDAIVAEGQLTELGLASRAQDDRPGSARPLASRARPADAFASAPARSERAGSTSRRGSTSARIRPSFVSVLPATPTWPRFNPLLVEAGALGGRFRFDFTVERAKAGLEMTGQGQLEGGRLVLNGAALAVTNLEGTLRASGRTIELVGFQGTVGDGRLLASGSVRLTDKGLAPDVVLRAERLPLEYPEGLRTRSSGQLRLSGQEGAFRLDGEVKVHTALYQRQTDRKSQSLDRLGSELEALDARGSLAEKVQLGIAVRLEDGLRVDNGQANLVVDGTLSVEGDLATPETERIPEHPGWRHRPPVPRPSPPHRRAGGAERLSPALPRAERPGANPGDGHRHRRQAHRPPRQRPDGAVVAAAVRPHPGRPRHPPAHRTHRFRGRGSGRRDRGRRAGGGLRTGPGQEAGRGRAHRRFARRIADRGGHQPVAALQHRCARHQGPVRRLLPGARPR